MRIWAVWVCVTHGSMVNWWQLLKRRTLHFHFPVQLFASRAGIQSNSPLIESSFSLCQDNLSAYHSYTELKYLPYVFCYWFHLYLAHKICSHIYRSMYTLVLLSQTHSLLPGSFFPSACRPTLPSVIHEPSAWASAVSDVCQTGPHLSPLFVF